MSAVRPHLGKGKKEVVKNTHSVINQDGLVYVAVTNTRLFLIYAVCYLVLHAVSLGSMVTVSVFMLERNEFSWVNLSAFLPMF